MHVAGAAKTVTVCCEVAALKEELSVTSIARQEAAGMEEQLGKEVVQRPFHKT